MGEVNKKLYTYIDTTLRGIVNFVNENNIPKEDLWYLDNSKGTYALLYFK